MLTISPVPVQSSGLNPSLPLYPELGVCKTKNSLEELIMLRMIIFECSKCGTFEELVETKDGIKPLACSDCGQECLPVKSNDIRQIHRSGNHYNHVSWSTWQVD